ncbi:MAG: hypothetical protein RLP14_08320 [Owenweeksia sp.]
MLLNVLGFHSNSRTKLENFLAKKELVIHDDLFYLGKGMYFWDNQGNARWWAKKKIKKEKLAEVLIAKAKIILEPPILDLTDNEVIGEVRNLWLDYCANAGEKEVNQPLGVILDTLFLVFKKELSEIKVTKAHGDYSHWTRLKWLEDLNRNSYIDNRPKTMYSIKCNSKLSGQELHEVYTN